MTQEYEENEEDVMSLENTYRHYDISGEPYRSIPSFYLNRNNIHDKYDGDDNSDDDHNVINETTNNSKDNMTSNMVKNQSSWNGVLTDDPFFNELIHQNNNNNNNNKGGKKNLGTVQMEMEVPMPTRIEQQRIRTELETPQKQEVAEEEEEVEIPFWGAGIDRFTNWIAKTNISPVFLLSSTKEILDQLNDINLLGYNNNDNNDSNNNNNNNDNNVAVEVLTYICYSTNLLLCRIKIDDYRTCDFQIGVYKHQDGNCLLDIQELSGEHLTFAHFLHIFKSRLEQREIIEATTFTPDNYGLDMGIDLENF